MWWLLVPAAYLLGSVSFAWIAGRLNGKDLHKEGSGNLGATNAGRVLGGTWFAVVMAGDLAKGLAPVLVAKHFQPGSEWLPIAVAVAAVVGHVFTCFHGFKGGKAVATSLGVMIGVAPVAAAAAFITWVTMVLVGWLVFRLKRSDAVGPASVAAALSVVPAQMIVVRPWVWPTIGFLALLAILVLVKHRSNMAKFPALWRERGRKPA